MTTPTQQATLGVAIQQALEGARETWIREHRRGEDPELYALRNYEGAEVTMYIGRGRQVVCYISITGKRPFDSSIYAYRLLREGPRAWSTTPHPLT